MRNLRSDDAGVSPVIATIILIGITVSLAGTVYLMTDNYSKMAGDKPEIFVADMEIDVDGVIEVDAEGHPTGHTYSALVVSPIHRHIEWGDYKVTIDGERVFTVMDRHVTSTQVPDASDDPSPVNSGRTVVGAEQYLTEEGYREDFRPLQRGGIYYVVIVNLVENEIVWKGDVRAI
ncbi:MAG: archaellin/type IV pilin N-terminal domain-containing protein [Thermoplasmatota archaeon]